MNLLHSLKFEQWRRRLLKTKKIVYTDDQVEADKKLLGLANNGSLEHEHDTPVGDTIAQDISDVKTITQDDGDQFSEFLGCCQNSSYRLWWVITFLLSLSNFVLLVYIWNTRQFLSPSQKIANSVFPLVEYEYTTFRANPNYLARPNSISNQHWRSVLPSDEGLIVVDQPENYGLPPGVVKHKSGDEANTYGVTWTHQYHCIQMLRNEFWLFVQNNSTLVGSAPKLATHRNPDRSPEGIRFGHLNHCFDYLRQTVVCTMDTTIEWPTGDPSMPNMREQINGYDIEHRCRKKSDVLSFMKTHQP